MPLMSGESGWARLRILAAKNTEMTTWNRLRHGFFAIFEAGEFEGRQTLIFAPGTQAPNAMRRYWIASATCAVATSRAAARSAIVRATFSTR